VGNSRLTVDLTVGLLCDFTPMFATDRCVFVACIVRKIYIFCIYVEMYTDPMKTKKNVMDLFTQN